jgi:hypothetical protein
MLTAEEVVQSSNTSLMWHRNTLLYESMLSGAGIDKCLSSIISSWVSHQVTLISFGGTTSWTTQTVSPTASGILVASKKSTTVIEALSEGIRTNISQRALLPLSPQKKSNAGDI